MYKVRRINPRYHEYFEYLTNHINGVISCWEDVLRPALEDCDDEKLANLDFDKISLQIRNHDRSKYSFEEFMPYCNHWYPLDGSEPDDNKDDPDYDYAWLHHEHCNPHHSQYWLIVEDDGTVEPLDMPLNYICEMIADWGSFHRNDPVNGELAHDWYKKNKKKFIMSDQTIDYIERIFEVCPEI